MIICVCHRVSHHDIARAVRGGCASFEELQFELGVATGCGACHGCARETFEAQGCAGAATADAHPHHGGPAPSPERSVPSVRRLIPVQALIAQAALA